MGESIKKEKEALITPIEFPGCSFLPPAPQDRDFVNDLPYKREFVDDPSLPGNQIPVIVSQYQFNDEALRQLNENGGKFFIYFLGQTIPPVGASIDYPVTITEGQ